MLRTTALRLTLAVALCAPVAPGLSARQVITTVTCNGIVCPRELNLVNGESVTIGLSGHGLDSLVSGVVTDQRARTIRSVSVTLLPLPARPVRTRAGTITREVTVTAQGAPVASGLRLRLTTVSRATVTAPLSLSVGTSTSTRAVFDTLARSRLQVAAGQAATLEVRGEELDRMLTGLRIESGGRPVSGVTAAVISQSPDALLVEIAVDRRATLPSTASWELVAFDEGHRLVLPVQFVLLPTATPATTVRIAAPEIRMTGLRFPIDVWTNPLRLVGLRFPIVVRTQTIRMTGTRQEAK